MCSRSPAYMPSSRTTRRAKDAAPAASEGAPAGGERGSTFGAQAADRTGAQACDMPVTAPAAGGGSHGISMQCMRFPRIASHILVFFVLTSFHAIALLIFKLNAVNGEYPFSPAATVVVTESIKLCLATILHWREIARWEYSSDPPTSLVDSLRRYANVHVVASTAGISALYTANNLLSYFCVAQMDPGTVAIAKSLVPYVTAAILRVVGRKLDMLQWACIVLQCSAVSITQHVPGSIQVV